MDATRPREPSTLTSLTMPLRDPTLFARTLLALALLLGVSDAGAQHTTSGTVAPAMTPAHTAAPFAVTVTGKGPPMFLIAGLASGGAVWDDVVAALADRYECYVLPSPAWPDSRR